MDDSQPETLFLAETKDFSVVGLKSSPLHQLRRLFVQACRNPVPKMKTKVPGSSRRPCNLSALGLDPPASAASEPLPRSVGL